MVLLYIISKLSTLYRTINPVNLSTFVKLRLYILYPIISPRSQCPEQA